MGSNDRWSSGLDVTDVAMNIVGFEVINKCRIAIVLTVEDRHGTGEVAVSATAMPREVVDGEVIALASVKSTCYSMNVKTLEAAAIHILYLLDGKLGRQELGKEP